jgi:hypothetical protein
MLLNITEHMNMNKSKKQLLTSILTHSGLYSHMPAYGRMSFIQWPSKKYASLSSAQEANTDEEADMGYESSWSEIFRSTRGWSKKSESLLTEMSHWKHLEFRVRANTKCLSAWSAECGEQALTQRGSLKHSPGQKVKVNLDQLWAQDVSFLLSLRKTLQ